MKKIHLKGAELRGMVDYADGKYPDLVVDAEEASDGYHTFDELYEHRIVLFIKLCAYRNLVREIYKSQGTTVGTASQVWRSKLHSDGSAFEGWFILGIGKGKGEQITYHLPLSKWDETGFAETLDNAPEWDGHTPADVIDRLKNL